MESKAKGQMVIKGCVPAIPCDRFSDAGWETVTANVPEEMELSIFLNQQELVTVQCTPNKLNYLVLGFLYNEGVIASLSDVASMRACDDEAEVDVRLTNADFVVQVATPASSDDDFDNDERITEYHVMLECLLTGV